MPSGSWNRFTNVPYEPDSDQSGGCHGSGRRSIRKIAPCAATFWECLAFGDKRADSARNLGSHGFQIAVGANSHLYDKYYDSGWISEDHGTPLGRVAINSPSAIYQSSINRVQAFVIGSDGYHTGDQLARCGLPSSTRPRYCIRRGK
jgi:hypothetical protein